VEEALSKKRMRNSEKDNANLEQQRMPKKVTKHEERSPQGPASGLVPSCGFTRLSPCGGDQNVELVKTFGY